MEYFNILKQVIEYINKYFNPGDSFFTKSIRKGLNINSDNKKLTSKVTKAITHLTKLGFISRLEKKRAKVWNYQLIKKIENVNIPDSDDSYLKDIFGDKDVQV